ncbi:MAG TPA: hypothetical protein VFI29_15410 [Hanamia sp.]|nr:hypothetical protein [Hanamia sp.]
MHYKHLLILMLTIVLFSCKKETTNPQLPPPNNPGPPVLLKDIVVSRLPSPYYHFEYDSKGKVNFVSFASDFTRYNVFYNNDRISEMRNNILVNKDRLQYSYDNQGKVFLIQYADSTGVVFARSFFTYDGEKLVKIERLHKEGTGFIIDRTLTMTYTADGNLQALSDHRPAIEGQNESTVVDQFEQYDDKINVDDFSLLHPDFFEHLFLLPGVKLQINNPKKETITGDGVHLKAENIYTYNDKNSPLVKASKITITNGSDSGLIVHGTTMYSYYE